MYFIQPLFLGIISAVVGILPPGLINMTAAKVGLKEGRTRAFIFASGATLVILIQTFIALLFASFIDKNPQVVLLLREIGLLVFVVLTIYFFWTPKKIIPNDEIVKLNSKKSRFFYGMLLSALNFFPIPFYVFVSVTMASFNYFHFENQLIYLFVVGSGIGSYFAFYCYITFFKKLETKTSFILNNMNYIIGSITGLVSIITLCNVVKYYFD
ncbi:MAG: LysE family transporter [Flavobacterium sp.]|nr:LysE family transporter [Flavobacterium sp.]